eukprot:gb/GECH01009490.1/.p1 GENE.gb/GECH01009490.1/~~gb/GECH01009490.1/.p1  ORF type:complete len:296 (+),score=78.86 gb/GECH01009490.1/:1-888(+)
MLSSSKPTRYTQPSYWNNRYRKQLDKFYDNSEINDSENSKKNNDSSQLNIHISDENLQDGYFDWFLTYEDMAPVLKRLINYDDQIIDIGAGNSRVLESLYEDGYYNLTGIDISNVICTFMKEMIRNKSSINYFEMDANDLKFEDQSFDVILDKGTFDCIVSGDSSRESAYRYLSSLFRILKINGYLFIFSHNSPRFRIRFLRMFPWSFRHEQIENEKNSEIKFYIYILKKERHEEISETDFDDETDITQLLKESESIDLETLEDGDDDENDNIDDEFYEKFKRLLYDTEVSDDVV